MGCFPQISFCRITGSTGSLNLLAVLMVLMNTNFIKSSLNTNLFKFILIYLVYVSFPDANNVFLGNKLKTDKQGILPCQDFSWKIWQEKRAWYENCFYKNCHLMCHRDFWKWWGFIRGCISKNLHWPKIYFKL